MSFDAAAYKKAWREANPERWKAYFKGRVLTPEQKARRLELARLRGPRKVKPSTPEQRAKNREKSNRWRAANLEKARARERELRALNPEPCRARSRVVSERRRKADPAAHRARNAAWAAENPEKMKDYKRRWNKANLAARAADTMRRHAAKLHATPAWLTPEHVATLGRLYLLASHLGLHVDHIVPLRGKRVCGLHVPWNLQLLTPTDNMRKSNKC